MNRKITISISIVFSALITLSFPHVYAEVVSLTVDVQTILLEPGQVIPLLDTKSVGNMTQLQVSATLPCDVNHVPKLKIIVGSLGNLTGVIDSSSDYASLTGPFNTCLFSDMISPKANLPVLNKVFLKNDGGSSVITNLGSVITLTGMIGNQIVDDSSQIIQESQSLGGSRVDLQGSGDYYSRAGIKLDTNSKLIGKELQSVTFYLKTGGGSPTGTAYAEVRDSSDNIKASLGSVSVSTFTANYVDYTFNSASVVLNTGDKILVRYQGGDVTNYISIDITTPDNYDGIKTIFTQYANSGGSYIDNSSYDARFDIKYKPTG